MRRERDHCCHTSTSPHGRQNGKTIHIVKIKKKYSTDLGSVAVGAADSGCNPCIDE